MRRHLFAAAALAVLALPGCVVYDHRADVTVQWVVGAHDTCLPDDTVVLDLTRFGSGATDTITSPCDDYQVTIDNLDPDSYAVSLTLVGGDGAPLVRLDDTISVHSGSNVYSPYSFY